MRRDSTSVIRIHQEHKPRYDLDLFYYGKYYKKDYRNNDGFSRMILGLKSNRPEDIIEASEILESVIPDNSYIAVIPSSRKNGINHIDEAIDAIKDKKNLHVCKIDRIHDVAKKATGEGSRSYEDEKASIRYNKQTPINNKRIYLIDDISTSGVSLKASKDLLMENGAADVICFALGNSVLEADHYNKIIIAMLMIRGVGRKYASEILNSIDTRHIESDEDIYSKIEKYAFSKGSIKMPGYDQFHSYIKEAERILKEQETKDIVAINVNSNNYPNKFREILAPPILLFAKGDLSLLHGTRHIAVVGSRRASQHGCSVAHRLGELFGENNIVVSGLAIGCDTYGHKGCLSVGGKTVAILPSPITEPEPEENCDLAKQIVEGGGLLLSEYYMGQAVQKGYFVARDRLQSALSDGVVVVETEPTGGTMHTVGYCRDQGKLLACYRHPEKYIDMDVAKGNSMLLEEGAIPIGNKEELQEFYSALDNKRKKYKNKTETQQISFDYA